MSRTFKAEFGHEEIVYLKTDPDQMPRMVTSITFRPGGTVVYCLAAGVQETWHFEVEISRECCERTRLGIP